ncbi:histidinol-phosphate transaminase [Candidatus Sumerlaeota bacterium]|nr:histidinol-phosphate transaminase [Candidatus Sumerlaeota bacterium]
MQDTADTTLPLRPFLAKLHPYTPGEQRAGANIVKLNTNENPYPPATAVIDEVGRAAARLALYPDPVSDSLRRALAAYHGVHPEQILVGNGSDEILRLLVHATIDQGGKVAVVDPTYSLYPVLAAQFEGSTEIYPLVDRQRLPEEIFDGEEPILLLPNPNPPIGTLFSRAEIADLCRARPQTLVAIDEAYVDFARRDAVPLLAEFSNLAITRTFSKSFSLAGMRIGYVIADAALVAALMKIKDSYNLNHLAQVAAAAAIASAKEMERNCARIVETREWTVRELRALGYELPDSHANFVFAIRPDAGEHYAKLRERGILVRYFDTPVLRDGMRITIGTPEQMEILIAALKEILSRGNP